MESKYLVCLYSTGRAFIKRVIEKTNGNIQSFKSSTRTSENKTYLAYRRELSKADKKFCGV